MPSTLHSTTHLIRRFVRMGAPLLFASCSAVSSFTMNLSSRSGSSDNPARDSRVTESKTQPDNSRSPGQGPSHGDTTQAVGAGNPGGSLTKPPVGGGKAQFLLSANTMNLETPVQSLVLRVVAVEIVWAEGIQIPSHIMHENGVTLHRLDAPTEINLASAEAKNALLALNIDAGNYSGFRLVLDPAIPAYLLDAQGVRSSVRLEEMGSAGATPRLTGTSLRRGSSAVTWDVPTGSEARVELAINLRKSLRPEVASTGATEFVFASRHEAVASFSRVLKLSPPGVPEPSGELAYFVDGVKGEASNPSAYFWPETVENGTRALEVCLGRFNFPLTMKNLEGREVACTFRNEPIFWRVNPMFD